MEEKDNEENKVIGDAEVVDDTKIEEPKEEVSEEVNKQEETLEKQKLYNELNKKYQEQNKKDSKTLTIAIFAILIFCALVALFIYLYVNGIIPKDTAESKKKENKNDIELKYTEVSDVQEGVYITDVSEVVDNAMPSIVAISSQTRVSSGNYGPWFSNREEYATGAGSGIIVSKSDTELMILTNNHVIEDANSLSVQFINNKSVDAKVKGSSATRDVAIITVKLDDLDEDTLKSIKIATIGDSNALKVGNGVIAIGNALGYGQSVTTGVISALNREVTIDNNTMNMIQIDAAINGGNSGGALLNSKGEVIGINSAKYSSSATSSSASIEGMGFAIPISDVKDLITRLMNGENLTDKERGYLGVSGYMITESYSEAYNMPEGFYISSIVEESGADKAKLEIGDIIVSIDGKTVTQFSDISEVLELKRANEKVTLKVKYTSGREYKEKTVIVSLSSYDEVN